MAAPMVSGVAALMASVNPRITAGGAARAAAPERRARLAPGRRRLPRRARLGGRRDDRGQLRQLAGAAAAGAARDDQGLEARSSRSRCSGSAQAITSYRVSLDGRAVASLRARRARRSRSRCASAGSACRSTRSTPPARCWPARSARSAKLRAGKRGVRAAGSGGRSRHEASALALARSRSCALRGLAGARAAAKQPPTITLSGTAVDPVRARRPRVLLPPRASATRRGSRSSAAGPTPASPTPPAASSTPGMLGPQPRPGPTRPAWCFTPFALSGAVHDHEPRRTRSPTSRAR